MLSNQALYTSIQTMLDDATKSYKANKASPTSTPEGVAFDAGRVDGMQLVLDEIGRRLGIGAAS